MVITPDYDLDAAPDPGRFCVRSHALPQCPDCSIDLRPFGRRERKVCRGDGSEICLVIRRLRCPHCRRVHHELPDFVIPYKRYDAEVIEDILCCAGDNETSAENAEQSGTQKTQTVRDVTPPDYPCESSTAFRLRIWFLQLLSHLEMNRKVLNDVLKVLNISKLSLEILKESPHDWLKRLFCVLIKIPLFS